MPKKGSKGGKNRRRGKHEPGEKRELLQKEEGQEYGQVLRMLGNGRLEAYCCDGAKRLCHIRGKMRKKVWVNAGDIVLVSLRDFQPQKGDVIYKYSADEARRLKTLKELPETVRINEVDFGQFGPSEDEGGELEFAESASDSSSDDEDARRPGKAGGGRGAKKNASSSDGSSDEDSDSDDDKEGSSDSDDDEVIDLQNL